MKYSSSQNNKGFTLIEIIVASAIFVIVMVVALGAVLSAVNANRKAQSLNSVINNLNFAFESMIRDMRTGTDYTDCSTDSGGGVTDSCITFKDSKGRDVKYLFAASTIDKYVDDANQGHISGDEVVLEKVSFQLKGEGTGDGPERILLHIQGYVGSLKAKSNFNIETLITSRALDVKELQTP